MPSTYVLGNCSEITVGGTRYVNTAGHRTDGRPVNFRNGVVPSSGATRDAGAGSYTDIDDMFVGGSQYTHYEQKGDRYTYQMSGPSRTLRYNLGIENDYPFMTLTSWPASSGSVYTLLDFYRGHGPAYASSSSRRYKHDIKPISGDRDPAKLLNLPVVEFVYNDGHPLQYADMEGQTLPGLIAEDVAEIYPAAAIRDAEGNVESWDERRIIPGMLALIQEQQRRIDKLEAQLAQLLDRLEG